MHRFLHILLLFLLTQTTTFAQVDSTAYAHAMADSISVGKSPSDTTTEVVGKLNLVTFEPKEINICLVPVNDVSLPGIQKLEKELNDIFRPAVASVRLSTAPSVKIQYADGRNFVHGGSGPLSVYSADEKSAIRALGTQQSDTYYLFMAKDVVKLDPDGNRTIVGGYMPVGRQFGFIFEQFDVASTIAHEVSHGAFSLHHTFSDESESYHAPQGTTPNLMDYSGGTDLNHLQWQWMHESHTNLLGFLDDESEGEAKLALVTKEGKAVSKDIPEGEWSDFQILRFDIRKENLNNLRMPRGNETGSNSEWIPGGFTPKGNSEAVIDAVDWTNVIQTKISK